MGTVLQRSQPQSHWCTDGVALSACAHCRLICFPSQRRPRSYETRGANIIAVFGKPEFSLGNGQSLCSFLPPSFGPRYDTVIFRYLPDSYTKSCEGSMMSNTSDQQSKK